MAENQFFFPTDSEMEILRVQPPTEESLALAKELGHKVGRLAVTETDLFENNLRVSLRDLQQRELHHIPPETFTAFADAAFSAKRYIEARLDVANKYGRTALNHLDISVHYMLAQSQIADTDI